MRLTAAALAASVVTASGAGVPDRFEIHLGKGVAVCEAYLKRLGTSDFEGSPTCGRPERPEMAEFLALTRVRLSPNELYLITDYLLSFVNNNDQYALDKERERLLSFCGRPGFEKICDDRKKEKSQAESEGRRWRERYSLTELQRKQRYAWKYDPPLDIDNDGRPDRVLMFRDGRCGGESWRGNKELAPTYAFIMDEKYQGVDEVRTRAIFGHPFALWPGAKGVTSFRYLGWTMGVFGFGGRYYTDTFFNAGSDFENKRVNDPALPSTLGVFERTAERTRQVCEYRWTPATNN